MILHQEQECRVELNLEMKITESISLISDIDLVESAINKPIINNSDPNIISKKFNSKLDINKNDGIYSFGQRFDYENSKHSWYVSPKYSSFKDELMNNAIYKLNINVYGDEYQSSVQFMETDHVKKLENISIYHILSLEESGLVLDG